MRGRQQGAGTVLEKQVVGIRHWEWWGWARASTGGIGTGMVGSRGRGARNRRLAPCLLPLTSAFFTF